MLNSMMRFRMDSKIIRWVLFLVVALTCFAPVDVRASDARNYNAGHIIDDSVFTNSGSMSVQDIQNWLNSKVVCDTWGVKLSEYGGGTRAQWMAARGVQAPFTCLRDYYENVSTGANNYGTSVPSGAISAAQIVYDYAQRFNINPQVLLVTLQKENGLVTDEWPSPRQYLQAAGFGCPDNVLPGAPACDPTYGGFAAQVYQAARHFRGYYDNRPGWWVPFNTGNNQVRWSPQVSCGSSTVYIENRSTVALYAYTPYQPNQAALNAQYRSGDSCSAYGNRNFYLFFTDWFGSTLADVAIISPLRVNSQTSVGYYTKVNTTVSFDLRNNKDTAVDVGGMAVTVRDSLGGNFDYRLKNMVIPPRAVVQYVDSQVLPAEGSYTMQIVNYSGGSWKTDYPGSSVDLNSRVQAINVTELPVFTSNISIDSELRVNRSTLASITIKNNSLRDVNMGKIGIGIRGPRGENLDLGGVPMILNAGQSYTLQQPFTPSYEGNYRFYITATQDNNATWESIFPGANGFTTSMTRTAMPQVTITEGISTSVANPHVSQPIILSLKLKNYGSTAVNLGYIGLGGRDPSSRNVDPGVVPVTLVAGEERTLSFSIATHLTGAHRYYVISTAGGGIWSDGPVKESAAIAKSIAFNVLSNPTLTEGPMLSGVSPRINEPVTMTFKVGNFGTGSVNAGYVGLAVRDPYGRNVDMGGASPMLASGQIYTYSANASFITPGVYTAWVTSYKSGVWDDYTYPQAETQSLVRRIQFTVLPSVVLSSSITSSNANARVGQSTTLAFTLKNYGATSVNVGYVGLGGRNPANQNVDPGVSAITLAPGETRVISFSTTFGSAGSYVYYLISTNDFKLWSDGPTSENSANKVLRFSVSP